MMIMMMDGRIPMLVTPVNIVTDVSAVHDMKALLPNDMYNDNVEE